jgi:oligoendopeptidase F
MYEQMRAYGQVDALPNSGKRGGACCMRISKDKPYVLLNFTNNKRELRTIAHEFGHAFHHLSMKDHHILDRHIGMFLAEYPSTFCEEFVSQQLMSQMSQTEQFDYRL